jgi:hypothetical protein
MEVCTVEGCGKTFKDRAGLSGHLRFSHPDDSAKATAKELAALRDEVTRLSNSNQGNNTTGVKKMEGCLDCLKKDQAKEFADRDHKAEIERLTAQVADAVGRASAADERVKELSELPSVEDFMTHCENCSEHGPALTAWKEKFLKSYVDGMTPQVAAQIAQAKGVELLPDKMTIEVPGSQRKLRP